MSDLHLHVCSKYFQEIKSGEKRVEYRLHCTYWRRRLVELPSGRKCVFDGIVIHNGYKPGAENRLRFPWHGWRLQDITHPHFGRDEVTVFAIPLDNSRVVDVRTGYLLGLRVPRLFPANALSPLDGRCVVVLPERKIVHDDGGDSWVFASALVYGDAGAGAPAGITSMEEGLCLHC